MIEVRLSPYHAPDGLFVIAAVRDITQRLHAGDQLRQALKMEAVGELTGGVAHDFNNLLTTILGNAELFGMGDRETDAERTVLINAIRRAGERAALLTRQLLAFSRKQSLHPEVIDLNVLIVGMADMPRQTPGDGIMWKSLGRVACGPAWWMGLPVGNGRQLAADARLRLPGLKVLFTTGYAQRAAVHDGALSSNPILTKPFTIDNLARTVRGILDRP